MNLELELIGESKFIKKLRNDLPMMAKQQKNFLLLGEKGTGKTTIAKLLHTLSSNGNLVILNSKMSDDQEIKKVLQSRFTGILIQDIDEFSFLHQSIILKALQDRRNNTTKFFITLTKPLPRLLKERKLLPELHNSLRKFHSMEIPSLRERQDDIPLLAEHFTKNACQSIGVKLKTLDINTIDLLSKRSYMENVGELKNIIEKAVFSSEGEVIELQGFTLDAKSQLDEILENIKEKKHFSITNSLSVLEKALIQKALESVGFNQTKAAKLLDLGGPHFRYRLRKYKIKGRSEN
jgi:DNA-binding NtrC family response regulator